MRAQRPRNQMQLILDNQIRRPQRPTTLRFGARQVAPPRVTPVFAVGLPGQIRVAVPVAFTP